MYIQQASSFRLRYYLLKPRENGVFPLQGKRLHEVWPLEEGFMENRVYSTTKSQEISVGEVVERGVKGEQKEQKES